VIPAVPLDTVSVKPTAVDGWLEIVAWVTVVVLLTLLWVSRSYLRYRATDPGERRHIRELRPQLLAGTSVTVRIRQGFDREDVLERLRAGFDREDVLEESDATVRDVAAGLASAAANARPSWVPVLAWRGILEGALLLVAGLVAFAPLAYWRAAVDPSPPVSAGEAAPLAATGVSIGVSALSTFPYSELVYGLVLATGILGVSGLWGSWLLPAAVLVAGGVALTWLHREIATWDSVPDDARIGRRRSRASLRLLSWGVGLWAVGVGLSSSARAVDGLVEADLAGFAAPVGFLAAVIAALIGVGLWVRRTVRRINELGETHPAETSAVVAYLVLRRVYLALAVVAAGLLVGYAGYAVITGRVVEVLAVVASAPTWVLGILGLAVLSLFVIAVLQLPGVLEDLRDLASRVTRSTALRLWVFARGVPIVGTVATFALVLAMSASIVAAGGTSILVGAVLRGIGSLIVRMKYAALRRYSGLERPVKEVHIAPFRVEDADGEGIWVADVDGTRLAHRELETLLEDVADSVRERTNTGKWPYYGPTTESEHYYHRVEMGFVDLERFRTKLRAATRLRTRVFLKDHGGELDDETARDELADDYPEWLVDDGITELRRRGIVDKRNDKLVLKG
jgi:uncharacterized protein (DUF433 family)